jgi:hypothetical protein
MSLDHVAVIPSIGIGDGLIMMVASHRLLCQNYHVTTFSQSMMQLKAWFHLHHFAQRPSLEELENILAPFDLIILQNDNSFFCKKIIELYSEGKLKALSVFYPSYEPHKHAPLTPLDRVFNEKHSMVDNTARAISSILGLNHISKNNGLASPDPALSHRRYVHRILLHPTSRDPHRNWPPEKFIEVAKQLQHQGFYPSFVIGPEDHSLWRSLIQDLFPMPIFSNLSELAAYAFESGYLIGNDSGIGHLASNLQLPTLVLSNRRHYMRLWGPGWYRGDIVTPPSWIPNFKGTRLRERNWKQFISSSGVIQRFQKLVAKELF